MAWTQTDVDALKTAIAAAGNAAEVRYSDGAQVRYMPVTDAQNLLQMMEADVAAASSRRVRGFRATLRSGY